MHFGKIILLILCINPYTIIFCQSNNEKIYQPNIHSVKLFVNGDQLAYPVLTLNSNDQLELHFDDLDGDVKNYYYTYQLCNADWSEALFKQFDYIKGFFQNRISTYRTSSLALTRYTHYSAIIPDRNSYPSKSGNYLLKVFLNGDVDNPVFTKKFLVVENKVNITARIIQPLFNPYSKTHQKVQFTINSNQFNITNPQQELKVVILQNYVWATAIKDIYPTFIRNNIFEYNTENDCLFPAGREWRWLNLTSFRLLSDRVEKANRFDNSTQIFLRTDNDRSQLNYYYYVDNNGMYLLSNYENNNPYWQSDYATVYFSYSPPNKEPYLNADLYLFGEMTNYDLNETNRMKFNAEKGVYEDSLFLKNAYYDYTYVLKDKKSGKMQIVDNNYFETENKYLILVYYSAFGARADELVGALRVSSLFNSESIGLPRLP